MSCSTLCSILLLPGLSTLLWNSRAEETAIRPVHAIWQSVRPGPLAPHISTALTFSSYSYPKSRYIHTRGRTRIDVVAKKGDHDRGQAFIVFAEQTSATTAMRALVGEEFYGRALVSPSPLLPLPPPNNPLLGDYLFLTTSPRRCSIR